MTMRGMSPLHVSADPHDDAPPPVLLPYQQAWIADEAALKIAEKSRRIGLTWAEAADDVLISAKVKASLVENVSGAAPKTSATPEVKSGTAPAPKKGPDFVVTEKGTAVPTSQSRMTAGFYKAGFPSIY